MSDSTTHVPAVTLVRRPQGVPVVDDFAVREVQLGALEPGQVHVRVLDLSLDPYIRSLLDTGHMQDPATPLGGVLAGRSVSEVVDSRADSLAPGTLVIGETGWRAEAVVAAEDLEAITLPDDLPPSAALGALGMPGLTAYAAHVRHLAPREGDTVVVSSAVGGVGSVLGPLAKQAGARTVALVGSRRKAELAVETLGYDTAVVRSEEGWVEKLRAACPDRINAYVHMGDQQTLDGVMEQLAIGARVSLVGVMDQYNGEVPTRLRAGAVIAARATVHGMVVYDHADLAEEHVQTVAHLMRSGAIPLVEDRYRGLEEAPRAFCRLMSGDNVGKVVVEVAQRTTG